MSKLQNLCPLPWGHLYINEEGNFYQCCAKSGNRTFRNSVGESISAYSDNCLDEWERSPDLLSLRQQMESGEIPVSCSGCFVKEVEGLPSYRTESLARYGEIYKCEINFLDIRFGNQCNLRCRMCYPGACSKLIPEMRIIDKKPRGFEGIENIDWYKSESFWNALMPRLKNLDRLHIAGGEPFIIPEVEQFLKRLCAEVDVSKISLSFNTNLTVLPVGITSLFTKFKEVSLLISLDGVGKSNDYIRYSSKFDEVEKNLKLIVENTMEWNLKNCAVHAVATTYSVMGLPELEGYLLENFGGFYHFSMDWVIGRECLDPRVLPSSSKIELMKRYEGTGPLLQSIMKRTLSADRSFLIPEFRRWTEIMDRDRGQKLEDYLPHLAPLMKVENPLLWTWRRLNAKYYYFRKTYFTRCQ